MRIKIKYVLVFGGALGFVLVAGMLISYTVFLNSKESNPNLRLKPSDYTDVGLKNIDFDSLLTQQGDFTYVKASQGTYFINAQLHDHYAKAKEEYIPVGFYHLYEWNSSGASQAQHFISTVEGMPTRLPLLVDLSVLENLEVGSAAQSLDRIKEFMIMVEKYRGSQVMIYTNERLYHQYIKGNFDAYDVWICSVGLQSNAHLALDQDRPKIRDHSCWLKPNSFSAQPE